MATPQKSDEGNASPSAGPESTQLALVPLHPATKRQKLDAKQLPIVLGRTNLAAWWWKSCPCQHYCRLHCRPVAQNIRSLSKVMIQIDTAGRVHIVGKNPHLIAITPEREDNILHVNDVISIGRRDREPWMRFQAIRKPDGSAHATESAVPNGSQLNNALEQNDPQQVQVLVAPVVAAAPPSRSSRRQVAPPIASNNVPAAPGAIKTVEAVVSPPEWITTSTTRNRNADNRSSGDAKATIKPLSPPSQQQSQQQRQQNSLRMEEAASAATIARVQRSYVQANHKANPSSNNPTKEPTTRKRRRRAVDTAGNEQTPKKSRRNGRSRKGSNEGESLDKTSGGTTSTTNGDNNNNTNTNKRDHSHVHLVFQDFQTSASLLEGNELRRREESCINQATYRASSSDSVVRQHHYGEVPPPRAFVADKSQLRLLSRNFAAALLGAVSPTGSNPEPPETQLKDVETQPNPGTQEQALDTKPAAMGQPVLRSYFALSSSEEYPSIKGESARPMQYTTSPSKLVVEAPAKPSGSQQEPAARVMEPDEASMLSLPQCASSSFEPGQGEVVLKPSQQEHETNDASCLEFAAAKKGGEEGSSRADDESASSPPSCDPIIDLKPWQEMVGQEEEKGNTSSFRHALASLIIAKNQDRLEGGAKRGLLWLPPLLGEDFKIESLKDTTM